MRVKTLTAANEFVRYVDFAQEVYRQNPYWVPSDTHHLTQLISGRNAFAPHSQLQAFWVEEGEQILATVTAVTDERYNQRWHEQLGHLLFFEALPGKDEAVMGLMRAANEWMQAQGCEAARLSLLPGWQLPLTIDAYDSIPTIFHTYNPPYYHSYIKNGGFRTECGVVQYQIQFTPELAAGYRQMIRRATDAEVAIRSWDFDRLEEETETFTSLFNETFNAHWGFMPLPTAAMRGLTVDLKDFLVPDLTAFAEVEGNTVGFVYSLPDLNQALHRMRGKVIEDNFSEFEQHLRKIDQGVLLIIGVRESQRGRGINLALAAKSYLSMIERGYKSASYTVVMDENWPSRRTAEKLGGKVTRNFNVYRKEFSRP